MGLWKEILDRGTIRQVVQTTTNSPNDTSFFFCSISDAQFQAMLDEINAHYKVNLKIENVDDAAGPGPDHVARGGWQGRHRQPAECDGRRHPGHAPAHVPRRFTCTISAISQYIHIPATSPWRSRSTPWMTSRSARACGSAPGPLATQTAKAFFPQHTVSTKYLNDLTGCDKDIQSRQSRPHHQPAAQPADRRHQGLQVGAHPDRGRHAAVGGAGGHPVPVGRQSQDRGQVLRGGVTAPEGLQ